MSALATTAKLLFRQPALKRSEVIWLLLVAAVFVTFLILPLWLSPYGLAVIRDIFIFSMFALSLDYLWGKAGILTFGHATFFGIGAYGMAVFTVTLSHASLTGLVAGIAMAGGLALIVGYFLIFAGVRLQYFAIITIALSLIGTQVVISWSQLTGGDAGLLGVPGLQFEFLGTVVEFADDLSLYFFCLVLTAAVLVGLWLACRGNYGKILAAIRMNEFRARSFGHHTNLHLLIAFIISSMLAALAGAMFAAASGFVAPDLIGPLLSTEVLVWVALGGRGTLLGPVLAVVVVTRLQQEISSVSTSLWPLLLGTFFVLMVFFFPNGIMTAAEQMKAWHAARRIAGERASP